ncbi:MAG TPA: tetratricopeptide repeat protein [Spirochaetota bacterium]|nr:tetratricopeptide repeat protein [Spirochaetota bacterium]
MKKLFIASIIIFFVSHGSVYALYRYEQSTTKTKIFFNHNDKAGRDAMIMGKVLSLSSSEELAENDLSEISHEKTKATVRLFTSEKVFPANFMYVIDPNNIVVSKLEVKYLFNNKTFGDMLIGYGNFKLSNAGYRVVQLTMDSGKNDSYVEKSRGDYFTRIGDNGKAIAHYKKAIESDPGDPAPHLGLGLVYYKDMVYNFAYAELYKAYKYKDRLYDNEDKFMLLKALAEIRFIETYDNYNIPANRVKFRQEGIGYCREALRINSSSIDVNFLLAEFYYRGLQSGNGREEDARDRYQKVLELQPLHPKANLRMANYYIRNNKTKLALFYAKKAVEGDPGNREALELLKRLQ